MAGKADFSEQEWATVKRAPILAGLATSLADPSGPLGTIKESMAAMQSVVGASKKPTGNGLIDAVATDISEGAKQRQNPLGDFKPTAQNAGAAVLEELTKANQLVGAKATADAAGFRAWLLDIAQDAAEAAKEGGFLGIGGERVSAAEQGMLDKLKATLV